MERQFNKDRARFEEKQKLSKKEKKERRRVRLRKARNAAALLAIAVTITTAEYAIVSQLPYQKQEPSCAYSPFQIDCTWNPVTPTPIHMEPTHVPVPEHEIIPSVHQRVR